MKYLAILFLLSSCSPVLYTGKTHRIVGGNAEHFRLRAEAKAKKADAKAMKELYGKQ